MGIDFVERFFKLTLDNVYRFTCGLLFIVAIVSLANSVGPVEQLTALLRWLAVPSDWLAPVSEWLALRGAVVGVIAALTLMVAIYFAATNDRNSRSGSTALLSIVILIQVGQSEWVLMASVIIVVCLTMITGLASLLSGRLGWGAPVWLGPAWGMIADVVLALVLAAVYLLSPLGWLVSQDGQDRRGSRWSPLYVEQVVNREA